MSHEFSFTGGGSVLRPWLCYLMLSPRITKLEVTALDVSLDKQQSQGKWLIHVQSSAGATKGQHF